MKKLAITMALLATLTVSTTAVVTNAATTTYPTEISMRDKSFTVTMRSSAYIYQWPSSNGSVIGHVSAGEKVTYKGSISNNMALITTKSGVTGYVSVNAINAVG